MVNDVREDKILERQLLCLKILLLKHSKRSVFCTCNALYLRGIYEDCVCREYTKIVFAGNIQRLCLRGIYKDCVCGEYTKTREVAH